MSALRVTLLGNATPRKTKLADELRSSGQLFQIFTPDTTESVGPEELTFLLQLDSSHAGDVHADRLLRSDLDRHNIPYQVLYGSAEECLAQAFQVIRSRLFVRPDPAEPGQKALSDQSAARNARWVWACDKCSDPLCEHRLLSGLLASRKGTTEPLP